MRASGSSFHGGGRWAGAEGGSALTLRLLPLRPASSAQAECGLGLPPPSTVLGPSQEAAARMLLTPGSPLGPCLWPFHSPLSPTPPRSHTHPSPRQAAWNPPRPHPKSDPLLKLDESRAWGELWGLQHIINEENCICRVSFPKSSKPRILSPIPGLEGVPKAGSVPKGPAKPLLQGCSLLCFE